MSIRVSAAAHEDFHVTVSVEEHGSDLAYRSSSMTRLLKCDAGSTCPSGIAIRQWKAWFTGNPVGAYRGAHV